MVNKIRKWILMDGCSLQIRPKQILPNFRKMYTTDGSHMQKYLHINLFGFWGIDYNDKTIFLVVAQYHVNKYNNTWTRFI